MSDPATSKPQAVMQEDDGKMTTITSRIIQTYQTLKPGLRFFGMYYIANMALLLSYPLTRQVVYAYRGGFAAHALPSWERQALGTLAVVTVVKFFRSSTLDSFFSEFFLYSKAALGVLVYMIDKWVFGAYMLLYAAVFVLCTQPKYSGPDSLHYFTPATFEEIVIRNKGRVQEASAKGPGAAQASAPAMWLVEFYASWSPPCIQIEPLIADISLRYTTPLVKFAKLDVGRWPHVAKRYHIHVGGTSKQLPTFIMFREGEEIGRSPHVFRDGSVAKGRYRKQDIIKAFELDALFVRTSASSAPRAQDTADGIGNDDDKKKK